MSPLDGAGALRLKWVPALFRAQSAELRMAHSPAPPGRTVAENPPRPYRWAMLGGVWLVYFSFGTTSAAMAPLVHAISTELGLSHSAMGSILGAWALVYILLSLPCGAVLDRYGPRRMVFCAMLIIALSGLLRGLADSYVTLFVAVAVFGIGGPLVSSGAPKVVGSWFTGKERGLGMGIYFTGNALGNITVLSLTNSVVVPMIGGWRGTLIAYAGFAALVGFVWLAITSHPASRAMEREMAAEPRRPYHTVFFELIGIPTVRIVLLMGLFILFFNHSLNAWLPEILRSGGMSPASAGYWASIPTAVGLLSALVLPRLAVAERRFTILFGLFLAAAGATLLIQAGSGPLLGAGLVLQGLTRGAMTSIALMILMDTDEGSARRVGAASGLYFAAGEIGGVLGPLTVGAVADFSGGFGGALFMLTAVCAILMALLTRLRLVMRR